MADKALNAGTLVQIEGQPDYRVKEISWSALRRHARDIYALLNRVREENPDVVWGKLEPAGAIEMIFRSTMTAVDGAATIIEAIIAESAGIEEGDVAELPAGAFAKLAKAVLEEQQEVIADFFDLAGTIRATFGSDRAKDDGKTGSDGKSRSSETSSTPDSGSQKSND